MEYWKQELYHHGILGMKWGKRNGPPYPLSPGQHSESEKKAGWRKSLKESRADRARTEADSARKIAKRYTDSMDKKANKRQAQYEAKPTRNRQLKAERARDEANTAKNIASKYTNAMDRKAEKRTNQARVGANKAGSRWVSDDQGNLEIIAKTALTGLTITAAAGLIAAGIYTYKDGGFDEIMNTPFGLWKEYAVAAIKPNKANIAASTAVYSAIKIGHKYMQKNGFSGSSSNSGSVSSNRSGGKSKEIREDNMSKRREIRNNDPEIKKIKDKQEKLRKEAEELYKKYDFDGDDGGGGRTSADQKAGKKYMELWDEIEYLDQEIDTFVGKKTTEYLNDKYGSDEVKKAYRFHPIERALYIGE